MQRKPPAGAGLLVLLKPYRWLIAALVVLTVVGNGLNLAVPKIISHAIDAYTQQTFVISTVVLQFIVVASFVFALTYLQSVVQTYASERVARDLRTRVAAKISVQSYAYVEQLTPAKLLTNLTSDIDAREAVRIAGDRLDHLFGVPDPGSGHPSAFDQLAAGTERSVRRSVHRDYVSDGVTEGAAAVSRRPRKRSIG